MKYKNVLRAVVIICFCSGEESKHGQRLEKSKLSIPATQYSDPGGRRGVRIHFYLQGVRKQFGGLLMQEYLVKLLLPQAKRGGTVFLDAKEDSEGKMQTCHLVVQVLIICPSWPQSDFIMCFPFRLMGTLWLWWMTDRRAAFRVHFSGFGRCVPL